MTTTEAIMQRCSVRTYTGEPLDTATTQKIRDYIAGLRVPFGAACRIELISTAASTNPVKLGTYGFIKGATDYLALIIEGDDPMAEVGAAYAFEQAVLFCTSLGLGTCWLGGSFSRGDFAKRLTLRPGERIRIVSPVGHAADKGHFLVSLMGMTREKPRKAFGENFYDGAFGSPLSETAAGVYTRPLEMVRRGPSANNKQSWRVVLSGSHTGGTHEERALHFYKTPAYGFEGFDTGIALCHFEQTCIEAGLAGHFEVLPNSPVAPESRKALYVTSWVGEDGP